MLCFSKIKFARHAQAKYSFFGSRFPHWQLLSVVWEILLASCWRVHHYYSNRCRCIRYWTNGSGCKTTGQTVGPKNLIWKPNQICMKCVRKAKVYLGCRRFRSLGFTIPAIKPVNVDCDRWDKPRGVQIEEREKKGWFRKCLVWFRIMSLTAWCCPEP